MLQDPGRPRLTDRPGQNELVPHIDQLNDIDVEADVVGGALAQNLFVHSRSILAEVEVIGLRSPAPPNVDWQLDEPLGLGGRNVIIVGQDDRAGIWPELSRSGSRHETEF